MSPPEKFEHYELLRNEDGTVLELGHGAMGVTYKAYDTNLHCDVALKVINSSHLNDPTAAERFLREARSSAQLRHRNVATVFHLGRCGSSYFYAMEFIEGETVEARVKREGPLQTVLAVEIAHQVAGALIAAHKEGLIHRDIKPSNLMLVREGDGELLVKVIDFGLVKSALIGSTAGALTSSGFVGTPYFASPEQLDQRSEDIRSDIYSLGVTLWYLLTGKPTFMGSVASVIAQHLDKPPAFESLAVLPACVVRVLRKMLEKDVEQRYQTPQDLRTDLRHCLDVLRAQRPSSAAVSSEEALETIGLSSTHGLRIQAQVGAVLGGRYRLIEDLDPAHPGDMFHAEDIEQKRRVRVTIVPCDTTAFAAVAAQVERVQKAAHRSFIAVLGASHVGPFGYVVSEWLEGFSLLDLLRARHELTLRETLRLLEQIAPTVDAARELNVRPALHLRDVIVHFPDGLAETDEQVTLRCPLAEWPAFVVKLDPLGCLDELEEQNAACERTMVHTPDACRPAAIAQVAALAYDLLGGKPGASAPLANVSETGNDALRRALAGRDHLPSAQAFVETLRQSENPTPRPTQAMPAQPTATAPVPRPPQPAEPRTVPPAVKPAAPAPVSPIPATAPERKFGPLDMAQMLLWRFRFRLIAASICFAVVVLIAALSSSRRTKTTAAPSPTATAAPSSPVVTRQPPRAGQPWKNSLDMRYVPVTNAHFATTETRVKDFAAFVDATGYDAVGGMYSLQKNGFKQHGHSWKNPGFPQSPEHPVVGVSYEDAKYFCDWLTRKERAEGALTAAQSYRLPTDREWSEAAGFVNEPGATPEERSGKVKAQAWGAGSLRANAVNFAGSEAAASAPTGWPVIAGYSDAAPRTCVVPGYGPNARGIYDLGGNVWEWCQDRFSKTTNWRVLRGGSWATSKPAELVLSFRRGYDPNFRHDDVGFRCVIATDSGER